MSRIGAQQGLFTELLNSRASGSSARAAQNALDRIDMAHTDFKKEVEKAKTPEERDAALGKLHTAIGEVINQGHNIFDERATLEIRSKTLRISKVALGLAGLSVLGTAAGATANALVQKGKQK
jgi:hypothetical protein